MGRREIQYTKTVPSVSCLLEKPYSRYEIPGPVSGGAIHMCFEHFMGWSSLLEFVVGHGYR